jgi:hypothetical protein
MRRMQGTGVALWAHSVGRCPPGALLFIPQGATAVPAQPTAQVATPSLP